MARVHLQPRAHPFRTLCGRRSDAVGQYRALRTSDRFEAVTCRRCLAVHFGVRNRGDLDHALRKVRPAPVLGRTPVALLDERFSRVLEAAAQALARGAERSPVLDIVIAASRAYTALGGPVS